LQGLYPVEETENWATACWMTILPRGPTTSATAGRKGKGILAGP
jgi:hypothetical protein